MSIQKGKKEAMGTRNNNNGARVVTIVCSGHVNYKVPAFPAVYISYEGDDDLNQVFHVVSGTTRQCIVSRIIRLCHGWYIRFACSSVMNSFGEDILRRPKFVNKKYKKGSLHFFFFRRGMYSQIREDHLFVEEDNLWNVCTEQTPEIGNQAEAEL